jgi:hypothetical protein
MEFGLDAVFVANSLHVRPGGEGFDDAHPPRCSRDAKPPRAAMSALAW